MRADWVRWLLGGWPKPPARPAIEQLQEDAWLVEGVRMRVLAPPGGHGPAPVLLVPTNHDWWGAAALRRGWGACLVSNCDGDDDTPALVRGRVGVEWAALARRAWAFCRAVDLIERLPRLDASRVAVAGHSRNGKAALIAAAFDPRLAGVIASSAGVLGAVPARLCTDRHFGEGIELLTRHYPDWFHPRLRWFAGAEERLPTDAHELLALVAPRPALLSVAVNDQVESTWAVEETRDALDALWPGGAGPSILWRPGGHELPLEVVERHLDWATDVFEGRVPRARSLLAAPPRLHPRGRHPFPPAVGARGARVARVAADGQAATEGPDGGGLRAAIATALGPAPPEVTQPAALYGTERAHVAALLGRDVPRPGVRKLQTVTREGANVDVYVPAGRRRPPCPLVLWLGPLCRATGYAAGYEQATPLYELLPRDGWAVACFDAIGTGARVLEEADLARRHPGWSPLGRWTRDALAALDAAAALDRVAGGRAWLVGYAAGAVAALHVAALAPERVAGVALVAPHDGTPLFAEPPAYGLRELLAAVGDRPALLLTPRRHPEADPDAIAQVARDTFVAHRIIDDHHRLSGQTRALIRAWMKPMSQ